MPTNFENNMTEPLINEEVLENYKQSLVSNKKANDRIPDEEAYCQGEKKDKYSE